MISKYSLWTSVFTISLLFFSSCLGSSNDRELEYPPDAQIYAFSLSSKTDTTGVLSSTFFSIDQVNGKIFNKEPLPYLFHVDSVILNIQGVSSYIPFANVDIRLLPDSTFQWLQSDSVNLNRLYQVTTTAPNGENSKTYTFQLNVYQQDPYVINWENITGSYLTPPIDSQKTLAFNDRFITYYRSGTTINAMSTPASDGEDWEVADLTELPPTVHLSSITASENAVFVINSDGSIFSSSNGIKQWDNIITPYPIVAIYGVLPSATSGDLLVLANHNDTLKFAETEDFTELHLMNDAPAGIPVGGFSAITVESGSSYAIKYIILSGGANKNSQANQQTWSLQKKSGIITSLPSPAPALISLAGSSLFFYDNKLYLSILSSGENQLIYSDNFGLNWKNAGENQLFPAEFKDRSYSSVITDKNNYIWIFGGLSITNTQLDDVWKGMLHKFEPN